ncbi:cellulase family glycosylhydrolase [Klebsiella pneumoniae]|nr:cellulase family glycosylhydrolase [Klebsiella pneumoniae]
MRAIYNFLIFVCFILNVNYSYAFEIGINAHVSRYEDTPENILALVKTGGFTSIRAGIPWDALEKNKGNMEFGKNYIKLDKLLLSSDSSIVNNSLLFLGYGNKNYTGGSYPQSKEQIAAFANYTRWIANRYKGKVKYYEIWNEWLVGTGLPKKTTVPDADVFIELVKESSKAIRQEDPNAIILTGSINPLSQRDVSWMFSLIDMGVLNYVDGLSIHPYSYKSKKINERNVLTNIKLMDQFENKLAQRSGKSVDLYITEMGFPTSKYVQGGVSETQAGLSVLRYTIAARSRPYIKGIWWYDLIDDGTNKLNNEHNFGFIQFDGTPKYSFNLLSEYSKKINDKKLFLNENDGVIQESESGGNQFKLLSLKKE